jgi:predicted lactoylglutathione lyase
LPLVFVGEANREENFMIIALPIADRQVSHAFYRDGLGLEAFGEPADDGVPEPLQLRLGADVTLMLIPTGGFGWVIAGRPVAERGTSECVLTLPVGSSAEVDAAVAKAVGAGAEVVTAPTQQPWAYAGIIADPDGHLWQVST